jgi:hypothetical protein
MPTLRELHGLRDSCVRRHALHVQQLCGAKSQEVEQIGIEPHDAAADACVEVRIDTRATAEHSVHELARPTTVARIELGRAAIERRIEQLAASEIRTDLGSGEARVGYATRLYGDATTTCAAPAVSP